MNKEAVKVFYRAYGYEPTEQEKATVKDMLAVWAKLEKPALKNPALSLLAENKQSRAVDTVTARSDM